MTLKEYGMIIVVIATILITGIIIYNNRNSDLTIPPNSTLCHKDVDCHEGQYCGFVSGYTAAVCRN